MKNIINALVLSFFITSCSSNNSVEPTGLEKILIQRLKADNVTVEYNNVKTTTNGNTTTENFLLVSIYNSERFNKIKHNQRILKKESKRLVNYLLDSIQFDPPVEFEELRLEYVDNYGFFIFSKKNTTTISYQVR